MDGCTVTPDINLLETGANVSFGRTLAVYAELSEQLFPAASPDLKELQAYLTEKNVNISRRRLYELNQLRLCVAEEWFSEDLRREEIRSLKNGKTQDRHPNPAATGETVSPLQIAHAISNATDFKLAAGEHCPYVVYSSSIKRNDQRAATAAFALILAVPILSYDHRQQHLPILEHAQTWPEPIMADSLEHFIIELARKLGYAPAWALTSGSRILHEPYIESSIQQDYLLLMGMKRSRKST